jgi:hypothetical protein
MEYIIFIAGIIVGVIITLGCVAVALKSDKGMIGRKL